MMATPSKLSAITGHGFQDQSVHDEPISTMASECESEFSGCVTQMRTQGEYVHAETLQIYQARFKEWTGYLGVFAEENGNLDQRLKRYPEYRNIVLLALDMLRMNLLQKSDDSSDESSSDTHRRRVELQCIQRSIQELDRLAIAIRQSSTSSLDARVKAFAAKRTEEISSLESKVEFSVKTLYPSASPIVRQILCKTMVRQGTRLLYWKSHDRKLRADRRYAGKSRDPGSHSEAEPVPVSMLKEPQSMDERELEPQGLESKKVHATATYLSGTAPTTIRSRLFMPRIEDSTPVQRHASASTVRESKAKFPDPPNFQDREGREKCYFCRKLFFYTDVADVGRWRKHVNEDLAPFACIATKCLESPNFASRSEWIAHTQHEHGAFWSRKSTSTVHGEQEAPGPHEEPQLAWGEDVCPICSSSPVELSRKTAELSTKETEPLEMLVLDPQQQVAASGSKEAKRTVRFTRIEQHSDLGDEETARQPGHVGIQAAVDVTEKSTTRIMFAHIADHLQFIGLLTPRLLTEKLSAGETQSCASSQAPESEGSTGKRSTLNDDLGVFEVPNVKEGVSHDSMPDDDLLDLLNTDHGNLAQLRGENQTTIDKRGEATGPPVDWTQYAIPEPSHNGDDSAVERMCQARDKCDALVKAFSKQFSSDEGPGLPYEAVQALSRLKNKLKSLLNRHRKTEADDSIPLDEQNSAIDRDSVRSFFHSVFSSVNRGQDDTFTEFCTEQICAIRSYQRQGNLGQDDASRRRLFSTLILNESPLDILTFIKEEVSDLDLPISAATLRQHFPAWPEDRIASFSHLQQKFLPPDEGTATPKTTKAKDLPTRSRSDYSIAWICQLPLVATAASMMMDEIHMGLPQDPQDQNVYMFGSIGAHNIVICTIPTVGMSGNIRAIVPITRSFPNLRLVLIIGMGGGVPSDQHDIRLGDVVVGTRLLQYNLGRPQKEERFLRPALRISHFSETLVSALRARHELQPSKIPSIIREKVKPRSEYHRPNRPDQLFQAKYTHESTGIDCDRCDKSKLIKRSVRQIDFTGIHYGGIALGDKVMKDGITRDNLAQEQDIICFSFDDGLSPDGVPFLMIMGIAGYSDSHKQKEWTKYAAAVAAAYASELVTVVPTTELSAFTRDFNAQCMSESTILTIVKADIDITARNAIDRRGRFIESLRSEQLNRRILSIPSPHAKSCQWITSHPDYKAWLDPENVSRHNGFMRLLGKPGSGKSTIMKYAFTLMKGQLANADAAVVSFFFNAQGTYLERSTEGMYRSILLQLFERFPSLQTVLDNEDILPHEEKDFQSLYVLKSLLRAAVLDFERQLVFFIDAIDECDKEQAADAVDYLDQLAESAAAEGNDHFRICFSSRHYPLLDMRPAILLTLDYDPGHVDDLANYITSSLRVPNAQLADLRPLILGKSAGVFLHVVLLTNVLNTEFRGGGFALRRYLDSVPMDLRETFRDILRRDQSSRDHLRLSLIWILFAKRPLSPEEFYCAIWSSLSMRGLVDEEIPNMTDLESRELATASVVNCSKGLAEVRQTQVPSVEFIHPLLVDFLVKDNCMHEVWPDVGHSLQRRSHEELNKSCTLYANRVMAQEPGFDLLGQRDSSERTTFLERYPFFEYASQEAAYHSEAALEQST